MRVRAYWSESSAAVPVLATSPVPVNAAHPPGSLLCAVTDASASRNSTIFARNANAACSERLETPLLVFSYRRA